LKRTECANQILVKLENSRPLRYSRYNSDFLLQAMVPFVTYSGRPRQAIEIFIVMSVLLLARELVGSVPYRNTYFMALTLATIAVIVWRSGRGLRGIGLGRPESWFRFGVWTGVALAGTIFIGLLAYPVLASWLPPGENALPTGSESANRLVTLVAVGWFAAAFGEEVTFRGFILPRLAGILGDSSSSWLVAIIVQALIFGMLHSSALGVVVASLFGLLYGFVFWRSGMQLWPVIIAHALPDTISILSG
jgi:membrane protease YdiL (CAAX protease family)